jgi:hypothetical protein
MSPDREALDNELTFFFMFFPIYQKKKMHIDDDQTLIP